MLKFDPRTTKFTSDTHFNHPNIIKYSKRPVKDVDEMNELLIRNWNNAVDPDDDVWHLGDFAMGNQQEIPQIVSRLNGRIHLCRGNHDKWDLIEKMGCFASLQDVAMFKVGPEFVFVSHYGHRVWNGSHKGTLHFYGHSHNSLPPVHRSIDVGVDVFNFTPVTISQIKQRLDSLGLLNMDADTLKGHLAGMGLMDHHGGRE
jgi:calcineurin-like phosphoesterase family protein